MNAIETVNFPARAQSGTYHYAKLQGAQVLVAAQRADMAMGHTGPDYIHYTHIEQDGSGNSKWVSADGSVMVWVFPVTSKIRLVK